MVSKKARTRVVLDTNVFVRALKTKKRASPNQSVLRLWLVEKRLQLIVSAEVVAEYLEIFERVLGLDVEIIEEWRTRFHQDTRSSFVSLGRRFMESRDPDDNIMLATALSGHADFLITNDKDLLDLPADFQKTLPFTICKPADFLRALAKEGE
jgi:putative PIN family toxin of toxin-antitoxin system